MKTRAAIAAALLALAALTGCSSTTEADPEACKAAMAKQLDEAMDSGKEGGRPTACEGLDAKTLERLAGEVTADWMESDDADKVFSDAFNDALQDAVGDGIPVPDITETTPPTTEASGVTPECREWIESELLDDSTSVDATPGYDACGHLTEDELDQAIEDVTNDLIEQGATPAS